MAIREEKRIIIDPGGVAELQVDRVKGDLRRKMSRKKAASSVLIDSRVNSVFPAGCKFVAARGQSTIFVIEQMPQVRTVQWDYFPSGSWDKVVKEGCLKKFGLVRGDELRRNNFRLAFPFMVFIVVFKGPAVHHLYVYFRNEPLRSLNDYLLTPCITNQHSGHEMCIDKVRPTHGRTMSMLAEDQIDVFWNSSFNKDLPDHFNMYRDTVELATVWHWEYWSRVDPSWPLRKDWRKVRVTIGKKVENALEQWSGEVQDRYQVFTAFERRIQAADEYQEGIVGQDTAELRFCPSVSIRLGSHIIRIGDKLRVTGGRVEGIGYGTHEVEYFFEPTEDGVRHVKFVGVADPVAIGITSLKNFNLESRSGKIGTEDSINVDGIQIEMGTRFQSTSRDDYPDLRTGHNYKIAGIRIDDDGDVCVVTDETGHQVYITHDGGKLHPSIKLLVPRLHEGRITFGDNSLSIGQYIRIMSRIARVENIECVGTEYQATLSGTAEKVTVFTGGKWTFSFNKVVFEHSDAKVVLDDNVFELGEQDHLLVTQADSPLALGNLYRILGVVPSERDGAGPCDMDIILEHANEPIPLIKEGEWVFVGYELTRLSCAVSDVSLKNGTRLRATNDKIEGIHCGDVFEVYCFSRIENHEGVVEIIFTDGQSIPFGKQVLESFEYCLDGNRFERFSPEMSDELPDFSRVSGSKNFKVGDRVKYTGNESYDLVGLVGTVCKLESMRSVEVRFDKCGKKGVYSRNVSLLAPELKLGLKFISPELFGEGLTLRNSNGNIVVCPPELVAEYQRPTGEVVASDGHGREIRLGDIVVSYERIRPGDSGYTNASGKPGIVVRTRRNFYFYIYYGRDVDGGHFANMADLDARFHSSFMKRRIGISKSNQCERLEVIAAEPKIEPVSIDLEVGNEVRVRADITPTYGWANVEPEEVGAVVEVDGDDVVVDFPSNNEWIGDLTDLDVVPRPLAVGDSVQVRDGGNPHYGWGLVSPDESGQVKKVDNGVVSIDFPRHPDWNAIRSDVEHVQEADSTS